MALDSESFAVNIKRALVGLCGLALLGLLLFSAETPTDIRAQLVACGLLVLLLIGMRFNCHRGWGRIAFLLLGAFISLRYILWRGLFTLDSGGILSQTASVILFLAEVYGVVVFLLGIFVNLAPLDRRIVPLSDDQEQWPTVDVFIPSYNEPFEIVRATLLAAMQIDYPKQKLKVYLLDDGGTDQKLEDSDVIKRRRARERRSQLVAFCRHIGVHYLTRSENTHAKAGNINSAFHRTSGDLILILDSDHVPTRDILMNTAGFFQKDPRLWLVQTPHFFSNPDPIERNLDTFVHMPSESEMFYTVIQRGLDFWNASFFCGSAGLLRRSHLEKIGGLCCQTVTEDAETSIRLHSLGYHSAYVGRPMISGMAPESFQGFITQRVRWAQGMAQLFLLKNPFRVPGLKLYQRLAYFSSSFFWFFPCARIVFLLAPAAYLIFGLHIYNAGPLQVLGYTVPHLVASLTVSDYLFGRVRWAFISELYEIMQSFFCLKGLVGILINPHRAVFHVTPKGETLDKEFISPLIVPFYFFMFMTASAILCGLARLYFVLYAHERYAVIITLAWTCFNAVILLAAFGALFERRQLRSSARLPADFPASIQAGSGVIEGRLSDLSEGGASFLTPVKVRLPLGAQTTLRVRPAQENETLEFGVMLRNRRQVAGLHQVGIEFTHFSLQEVTEKIRLVFGYSERWLDFQKRRESRIGIVRSTYFLLALGFKGLYEQLLHHKTVFVERLLFPFRPKSNRSAAPSFLPLSPAK